MHTREEVDQGAAQSVTIRKTVATVADSHVPNPVSLQPYITFPEIPQPNMLYVFRIKQPKPEDAIKCALFPVEFQVWKSETVDLIRNYLTERVSIYGLPAVIIS